MRNKQKKKRVSLQIPRQPLEIDQRAGDLQQSLILIKMLKQQQKLIYRAREHEFRNLPKFLAQSNNLLAYINKKHKEKQVQQPILQSQSEAGISSVKVLEELDVHRKQKLDSLKNQNNKLIIKIECLEQSIQAINNQSNKPTLTQQYINKLEQRINKRKLKLDQLTKYQKYCQSQLQKYIKQIHHKFKKFKKQTIHESINL